MADYTVKRDSFVADKPRVWFGKQLANLGTAPSFDLAPDGKRFVVLMPAESPEARTRQMIGLTMGSGRIHRQDWLANAGQHSGQSELMRLLGPTTHFCLPYLPCAGQDEIRQTTIQPAHRDSPTALLISYTNALQQERALVTNTNHIAVIIDADNVS